MVYSKGTDNNSLQLHPTTFFWLLDSPYPKIKISKPQGRKNESEELPVYNRFLGFLRKK